MNSNDDMEALRALASLPDWEELLGSEAMVKSVSEVLQGEGIPIVKREENDEDVEFLTTPSAPTSLRMKSVQPIDHKLNFDMISILATLSQSEHCIRVAFCL